MTLDEKVAQLGGVWVTELVADDRLDVERARVRLRHGTGHVTRIGASTGLGPAARARLLNDIQRVLVEDTRLGIPAIVHEESVGGFCARDATVFPQAIGLAATWDPDLVEAVAGVIREQMLAVGARHTLSPVLGVARDPRWGRVEETYGEDPYLAGVLGTAYVRGLQTDDLGRGVVCTGKHFLAYGLSEGGMNHAPVQLGPRELREVFAEPFARDPRRGARQHHELLQLDRRPTLRGLGRDPHPSPAGRARLRRRRGGRLLRGGPARGRAPDGQQQAGGGAPGARGGARPRAAHPRLLSRARRAGRLGRGDRSPRRPLGASRAAAEAPAGTLRAALRRRRRGGPGVRHGRATGAGANGGRALVLPAHELGGPAPRRGSADDRRCRSHRRRPASPAG